VLPAEQQGPIAFIKESGLRPAEVAGCQEVLKAQVVARWPYEEGKSLVPPKVMPELPTQMRRLHQWYMDVVSRGEFMQATKFKDDDLFCGDGVIWLNWEELYQLYHQDYLDISLSFWIL
jgi:hypothetical protein